MSALASTSDLRPIETKEAASIGSWPTGVSRAINTAPDAEKNIVSRVSPNSRRTDQNADTEHDGAAEDDLERRL
jgi:hypothetical protein